MGRVRHVDCGKSGCGKAGAILGNALEHAGTRYLAEFRQEFSAEQHIGYGGGSTRLQHAMRFFEEFVAGVKIAAPSMQITASKWLSGKSSLVASITWKVQPGVSARASAI